MSKLKKVVIGLVILLIAIPLCGFGYLYFKLNSMYDKTEAQNVEKIESTEEGETTEGITNVLLAGVDGNNLDRGNRSDAMMILTLDSNNNDIRLTSLARDTYVDIEGYGTEKLTHAYAYGGPSLLLKTIKNNFGISIDKYAVVSFESFKKIIDGIGGVEINVTTPEVSQINGVNSAGSQILSGSQALEYSRIRYIDSAYARDNRQRTVIESAYNKLSSSSASQLLNMINTLFGYTKTNMTPMEIISLSTQAIKINDKDFDQLEFPLEGYRTGHIISNQKGWVIEWEKDHNLNVLSKFIYNYDEYKTQY